jgi:hypothetical protein
LLFIVQTAVVFLYVFAMKTIYKHTSCPSFSPRNEEKT